MSSPTGCCMRAARKRRCSSAPTPCAASSSASSPKPGSSPGRAFPISPIPAPRNSPACRAVRRWSGSRAEDVYGIAEIVRRQRGGAAVVLGALSPAHAQCPGRALPVRRCRFPGRHRRHRHGPQHGCRSCRLRRRARSSTARGIRPLTPAEIGQIAGRAGRYMNDGTFGVTGECEPFDEELVSRVESHRYDPVQGPAMAQCRARFPVPRRACSKAWMRRRRNAAWPGAPRQRRHRAASPVERRRRSRRSPHPRDASGGCGTSASCPISANLSADEHAKLVRTHLPVPDER